MTGIVARFTGLLCSGFLVAGPAAVAQERDWQTRVSELERSIPALMDSGDVTGLAIALVADGEVVWSRGFGTRNAATGEPVDEHTVFEAASLSKPVFARAVLQMVERGEVNLDKPLWEYLPYEDIAHDERYKRITARMVLSHTPGFPNWRPHGGKLTIDFEPGTKFSYSGEGFVYLQRVVEHLTGEPMDQFVARTVLQPLGMTRSSFIWEARFESNVAMPYRSDGSAGHKSKPRRANAAASLHTTAPDFARFMAAVVNGEGLGEQMIQAMLTPESEVDSGVTWGLGWGLQDTEDGRAFWHWGHNTGYRAYTVTYPERRLGVVMFTNSDNGMSIVQAILSRAVGGSHPGFAWLDYEAHDAPTRLVRKALERTIRGQGIAAGIDRYYQLKQESPADAFEESMLNTLGYSLLRTRLVEEAIAVFKLNVRMYPDAFNTYDSLGEAYMVHGDTLLAIENYEKSVKLNPENTNGIRMLERLRQEPEENKERP